MTIRAAATLIDFHTHALPWQMLPEAFYRARAADLIAAGRTRGTDLDEVITRMRSRLDDPHAKLLEADLRAAGADHAVLIGIDWGLLADGVSGLHPAEQLLIGRSAARRSGGFFSFVLSVDPRRPDAADVVAEAFAYREVVGVKLYPPLGFWPDEAFCLPIYEAARQSDRFVMFHTGRQGRPFSPDHGGLDRYSYVQERYGDLQLILCHAGAVSWGDDAIEAARAHPNTFLEVSGWNKLLGAGSDRDDGRETVRSFLTKACAAIGPSRVLFGSDHLSGTSSSTKVDQLIDWWSLYRAVIHDADRAVDPDVTTGALLLRGNQATDASSHA
jgi:hypothetical protein